MFLGAFEEMVRFNDSFAIELEFGARESLWEACRLKILWMASCKTTPAKGFLLGKRVNGLSGSSLWVHHSPQFSCWLKMCEEMFSMAFLIASVSFLLL